jgi:hypothetical protein
MMDNDDSRLDSLFQSYRAACPDVEPGPNFMPLIWQKIDARGSFPILFERLGKAVMTASAALCLLLLIMNFVLPPQAHAPSSYVDALLADHTAEKTYYTEAIRPTPASEEGSDAFQH